MEDGTERRRTVRPLDWRALMPDMLAASLDTVSEHEAGRNDAERLKGVAEILDSLALEAANRGIDFNAIAAPHLERIKQQVLDGVLTEGQAEFMRDEQDALLQMINWAFAEGIIDLETKSDLHEAVN